MKEDTSEIEKEIAELEAKMQTPDFWSDKTGAQETLKKLSELKLKKEGLNKYDRRGAILSIVAGAGGDDAEDFARMLLDMYVKFARSKNFTVSLIHEHTNNHGGYKNVSLEISGRNVYGSLKNESGVHRLVRISPFNANKKRHTSFVLVEVLPELDPVEGKDIVIPEGDLKIEFTKSGGPGGQNVNKRETAVRLTHLPTGISVHASTERSQEANRARALAILRAKLIKKANEEHQTLEESMKLKGTEIEWGSQIRSYVLHPYKMVKDHRTNVETADVSAVLERGEIDSFIEAERHL